MSLRLSSSQSSHLVSLWGGLGIPGSEVPTTGDNGGSPLANDGITSTSEYRIATVTLPSAGALTVYPDTSFEFAGAPDGEYEWVYRVFEDSIDRGTATEFLIVGSPSASFASTVAAPVFAGSASVAGASPVASCDFTVPLPAFAGSAGVAGASFSINSNLASPAFTGSMHVSPVVACAVTAPQPEFAGTVGVSTASFSTNLLVPIPTFSGSAQVSPIAVCAVVMNLPVFSGFLSGGSGTLFRVLLDSGLGVSFLSDSYVHKTINLQSTIESGETV